MANAHFAGIMDCQQAEGKKIANGVTTLATRSIYRTIRLRSVAGDLLPYWNWNKYMQGSGDHPNSCVD
jgi:hypothetical protein